ncbi:MAG: VOC family protein [Rubrivivax sp.]|nr:VOC family protein [Rubrivivax sp.]
MPQANAIGWFDLYVDDLARATAFYESVFEQALEPLDDPSGETAMRAFPARQDAYGAAGALVKTAHTRPGAAGTMVYFSVEDCAATEHRVRAAKGTVLRPRFSIGAFGWVSICEDTEGNRFGLNSMR